MKGRKKEGNKSETKYHGLHKGNADFTNIPLKEEQGKRQLF